MSILRGSRPDYGRIQDRQGQIMVTLKTVKAGLWPHLRQSRPNYLAEARKEVEEAGGSLLALRLGRERHPRHRVQHHQRLLSVEC